MGVKEWFKSFQRSAGDKQQGDETVVAPPKPKPKKYVPPTKAEQRALMTMNEREAKEFVLRRIPEYVLLDSSSTRLNWWRKSGNGIWGNRPNLKYQYDYITLDDLFNDYPNFELYGSLSFLGGYKVGDNRLKGKAWKAWRDKWEKKLVE
ncbi:hypothetical protein [Secundilactobacillus yichangensis]|uniref:hypothetical protein n=1 Tax=Secundilactobacillus yichangensis TaxID=2799580 RepID=UPI001942FA4C|nr:hypothetical protein [Secundilactobacillus yichangensis]